MKKHLSIKNMYLLFVVSFLLIVLAVGSTYAIFTVDKKIESPIVFTSSLTSENGVIDTITVSLGSGESKRTTLNIKNDSSDILNYVVWTDNSNDNIQLGVYSGSSSGSLASGASTTILIDMRNSGNYVENVVLGISSSNDEVILNDAMNVVSNESLPPIIAGGNTWYNGSVDKATITKINFVDSYTVTGNENESWNAAFDIDGDGSLNNDIMCYLNGTELTIAGNGTGKIYANEDSSYLFDGFSGVTSINNLTMFDTSKVISMEHMFSACSALTSLDLSGFDTSNVTHMGAMFTECDSLETLDLTSFNTSNVIGMDYMFWGSGKLTSLDVSSFDTSKVVNMSNMFGALTIGTIDISSFNTSKVTNMSYMFAYDYLTKTIYVSDLWSTASVTASTDMFPNCDNLVGGANTKYSSSYVDKTYARVDSSSTPGYFTYKDAPAL